MRDSTHLDPNRTQTTLSETFNVVTCQVNNTTGSAVLVRFGGNDYPTTESADIRVPPGTYMQFPIPNQREFGFVFENAALLGSGTFPSMVAQISVLDVKEFVGSVGAIQQSSPSAYYQRGANPKTILLQYSNVLGPHAAITHFQYVVPANRAFFFEWIAFHMQRLAVATAFVPAFAAAFYVPNGQVGAGVMQVDEPTTNTLNQTQQNSGVQTNFGLLLPGDFIYCQTGDGSTGGSVNYTLSFKGTEYDF